MCALLFNLSERHRVRYVRQLRSCRATFSERVVAVALVTIRGDAQSCRVMSMNCPNVFTQSQDATSRYDAVMAGLRERRPSATTHAPRLRYTVTDLDRRKVLTSSSASRGSRTSR